MNLFKKISLIFIILAFISKIALASNYNYKSNANGIFEIQSIMIIDEMPAQFNGKVNTSGDVEYNGQKLKSVTSCLYSVIIKKGVAVFRATCRDYFDEENVLYTSLVSEYNFPANGADGVVTVIGGEGMFEDATGEGTNTWNSAGITDPNNSNMGYLKVTTKINIISD
tara:strand:+ start:174 stop:677 length:504 start_codon:yes stop_codon:yes gene_type:complete